MAQKESNREEEEITSTVLLLEPATAARQKYHTKPTTWITTSDKY